MVKVTWLSLPCVLENALAFISLVPRLPCERIGPLATPRLPCLLCLSFTFLLLKPKTPKYLSFSVCSPFLIQSHLSTPSAPHWVQHSYLSKNYDRYPRLVGHQEMFAGAVVGEVNKLYPPTPAPSRAPTRV